jgi:hypothetical protein
MIATLPVQWQQTQLIELGGGWWQLTNIPTKELGFVVARLIELKAKRISVPTPTTLQFSVGTASELVKRLKAKFPTTA